MVFVCLNVCLCFGKIWFLSQVLFWMTRYLITMMFWLRVVMSVNNDILCLSDVC